MKKYILLFSTMVLSMSLWAAQFIVQPKSPESSDNIRRYARGDYGVNDGDTLLLVTGEYVESQPIKFQAKKNLVVMAADGEKPVVKQTTYSQIYENATFIGIKFDGGSSAEYTFYIYETATKKLVLKNCEVANFTKYNITGSNSTAHIDSIALEGCFFHDNGRSAVYAPASSLGNNIPFCNKLTVTNSTFCNVTNCTGSGVSVIDIRNNGSDVSGTGTTLLVDHVTIYNFEATTNGAIMSYKSPNVTITNSIIANPSSASADQYATYCYGTCTIANCLTYNTKHKSGPTPTGKITGDPLFVDPANLDFTLAEGSPAIAAGTDGKNLGDPRWTPQVVEAIDLPATLSKANMNAKSAVMPYYETDYFDFGPNDSSNDTAMWVNWLVNINKGKYNVEAVLTSSNNYKLQLEFINVSTDATEKTILADKNAANFEVDVNDLVGQYYVRLKNQVAWSKVKVKSLDFKYAGGSVVNIPATLPMDEVLLTGEKVAVTADGLQWDDLDAPAENYASWNVSAAKGGIYEVVITEGTGAGHNYAVSLMDGETVLASVSEGADTWKSGAITLGTITIGQAGEYVIRLNNNTQWSSALTNSVAINYVGGAVVELPATLPVDDALLTGKKVAKTATGLQWDDLDVPAEYYATWNVLVAKAGLYRVVLTEGTNKGHNYAVSLMDGETVLASVSEGADTWKSGAITLGILTIEQAGEYTVRLNNNTQWSSALTNSLAISFDGALSSDIPAVLPAEDAMIAGKITREGNAIMWPNKSDVASHYATWNVNATMVGDLDVIVNIGTPSSGHCFTVALYDGETLVSSIAEAATVHSTGAVTLGTLNIPSVGSYVVRLTNATEWSSTIVQSVSIAPKEITISEEAEDNSVLTANEGKLVKATLTRSLTAGMFNTICLPFALSAEQIAESDLAGARIIELTSTSLEDQKLYLNYTEVDAIEAGKGYLIEPAAAVENPVFEGVTITKTAATEETVDAVKVIPTLIVSSIPASTANLYLYLDNTLYYAGQQTTIKGMRLYYNVSGTLAPARMLINGRSVATGMDEVEQVMVVDGKFIQDGKMYIMKNGVVYNAQGQIVK